MLKESINSVTASIKASFLCFLVYIFFAGVMRKPSNEIIKSEALIA